MTTAAAVEGYPVEFDVEYPERLSRWLIFVKWLLVIPHLVVLYFLQLALGVVTVIAFFAILFTEKYPRSMFDFAVGVRRWQANVTAYYSLLRDEYPPFTVDPGKYPVHYAVAYPERLNRWMPLVKWLLVIPHIVVLALVVTVLSFVLIIAFFAILFTARFPEGLFGFTVGAYRWTERVNAYALLMTDEYPPFGFK